MRYSANWKSNRMGIITNNPDDVNKAINNLSEAFITILHQIQLMINKFQAYFYLRILGNTCFRGKQIISHISKTPHADSRMGHMMLNKLGEIGMQLIQLLLEL